MPIARFKDLCIDTGPTETLGRFWASALGLSFEPDGQAGSLSGSIPTHRIWMNVVPEPKTARHRVHLDVRCASIDDLVALGATVLEPAAEFGRHWTVLADPEGGEFCGFVRAPADLPDYRLYEVVVSCQDARMVATWWADVLGASLGGSDDDGYYWLEDAPGLPFEDWCFVPVPEPKTVKNRVHWDVVVDAGGVETLVAAGATVIAEPTPEAGWWVLADPEGNEFCAFERRQSSPA